MKFFQRPFRDAQDIQLMTELAHQTQPDNLHAVDLPYRFSSWAMDEPENTRLWFTAKVRLVGWAVMQTPFWSIDYVYDTNVGAALHPQILEWAYARAHNSVNTLYGRPAWFINVFANQQDRIKDLEMAGFASQADVGEDSWTKVLMKRTSEFPPMESQLPDGFRIRPLQGRKEASRYVEIHQTTFESKSMTIPWRARTLLQQDYTPDLDLVIEAPDGRLAAFCIGWMKSIADHTYGQIEPLGVHPDFRRLGLGHAIINAVLRLLAAHGTGTIFIETDNYRDAAFTLYESVGFRVQRDILVFRKDFSEM